MSQPGTTNPLPDERESEPTEGTSGASFIKLEGAEGSATQADPKMPITLTAAAVDGAKAALAKRGTPDAAIRLGIRGGGCSGFSYVIEFEDALPRERDRVFDVDGVKVVVDKKSLIYLHGSVLDFEKTLMRQGFKFRNPNEASTCGCGTSFTVK
ncbi:MAG: iron-sulfur cluster assembly accessory protein [Polyangiaceae bacterium]|jgi:iron-sulfur cluster assembly protein|nr:iron-sulfur cluster assembly accessory protein [Polyangiaceae bacterium]